MKISKIKLKNFRNYESLEMIFEKGINCLIGCNGVGKTNLIEAIYYVSNLESFRTSDDRNLIKNFKGEFFIDTIVNEKEYSLLVNKDTKLLNVDGIIYKKYRDYLGKVNVVEFCPEEVYLLKDFPRDRRKFLDKEISKIDKEYMNNILIYNKLLKQRNEVLKSDDYYKDDLIDVIDEKTSELQVSIINKRKEFLKEIEKYINEFDVSLCKLYNFKIVYESSFQMVSKEEILKKYKETLIRDKERMTTGLGIHKDDFKIYINDCEASSFGSQGEQRFIVLLIKLALVNLIKKKINDWPILVLDDVFSELDENRKKEIYFILKPIDQVFITGCNISDVEDIREVTNYKISQNKIEKIKEENTNE